jgi:opacity protein-like surface antigen
MLRTALPRLAAAAVLAAALPGAAPAQYYPPAPPPGQPAPPSTSPAAAKPFQPHLELTAIAGYQLNTSVNTSVGQLSVDDTPVYGASVGMEVFPGARAELMWLYSNPTMHASGTPLLNGSQPIHVPTHYFQIGGTRGFQYDRIQPFVGATIGAVVFLPSDLVYSNGTRASLSGTWRFAFTLGAGLDIHLAKSLALQASVRLAAPVYFTSGSVWVGSGGASLAVSGGIPIWQWNFMGGLVFSP